MFKKSHSCSSTSGANLSWLASKITVNNQDSSDRITGLTCFFWEWEMKLDRKGEQHPDLCPHPGVMIWQIIWIRCVLNSTAQSIPRAKKNRKCYVKKCCLLEWVNFLILWLNEPWLLVDGKLSRENCPTGRELLQHTVLDLKWNFLRAHVSKIVSWFGRVDTVWDHCKSLQAKAVGATGSRGCRLLTKAAEDRRSALHPPLASSRAW